MNVLLFLFVFTTQGRLCKCYEKKPCFQMNVVSKPFSNKIKPISYLLLKISEHKMETKAANLQGNKANKYL